MGVLSCFNEPVGVLLGRSGDSLHYAIHVAYPATLAQLFEAKNERLRFLRPKDRKALRDAAEAYIREMGERAISDKREDERIAALAFVPEGDSVCAFVRALDAALDKTRKKPARLAFIHRTAFETDPYRVVVHVDLSPSASGSKRDMIGTLALGDWRDGPLDKKIAGKGIEHLVLRAVWRVLRDPGHPAHAALVGYLNEPSWTRVLSNLEALAKKGVLREPQDSQIQWMVQSDVGITPYLRTDTIPVATGVSTILEGRAGHVSPQDEAVAAVLADRAPYYARRDQLRERIFRALSLLDGRNNVISKRGTPLRVHAGSLGVALERDHDGFHFVFDIGGRHLSRRELRDALDEGGHIIHIGKEHMLLAHVGTQRAMILRAMLSEDAVFPAQPNDAFTDHMLALHQSVGLRLPKELAGEQVQADSRPLVRMTREGSSLSF